jgi:SAM-dependent methyltransferase
MGWFSRQLDKLDRRLCRLGILAPASWEDVRAGRVTRLYAGSLDWDDTYFANHYGMRLSAPSRRNLVHDVSKPLPIADNSIDSFVAEDVLEYPSYEQFPAILDEVYRVLKPGGRFRMGVPDFRNPLYRDRSLKAADGSILFDPLGGGRFVDGKVVDGGTIWFPVYETVKAAYDASRFAREGRVEFLHYTDANGVSVLKDIDHALGPIRRTPDFDPRAQNPRRALSIVVDAVKFE